MSVDGEELTVWTQHHYHAEIFPRMARHSGLGMMSPADYERALAAGEAA